MIIEVSTRHGHLDAQQQDHLRRKAEKLLKYLNRLMGIEVAVEHVEHEVVFRESTQAPTRR